MGMLAFPPDTHISPYKVTCRHGAAHTLSLGPPCLACLFPVCSHFAAKRMGQKDSLWAWKAEHLSQASPGASRTLAVSGRPALHLGILAQVCLGPSLAGHSWPCGVVSCEA